MEKYLSYQCITAVQKYLRFLYLPPCKKLKSRPIFFLTPQLPFACKHEAFRIAVDSLGNAYLTGKTDSPNLPATLPVPNTFCVGTCGTGAKYDAFVAEFNPSGTLAFSSYVGGSLDDLGIIIALDSSANVYLTGCTNSTDFPASAGSYQTSYQGDNQNNCNSGAELGGGDAFITKLNPATSALVYSTYLGGSGADYGNRVTVDSAGNAYVTGHTSSTDFPTTAPTPPNAFCIGACAKGASNDAFVTELNSAGSALIFSTYLGGSNEDDGFGAVVDGSGNIYVVGRTESADFPKAPNDP